MSLPPLMVHGPFVQHMPCHLLPWPSPPGFASNERKQKT